MISIPISILMRERKTLERVFGSERPSHQARILSEIAGPIRDILRENHAVTQQEWMKRGLNTFGSKDFKTKKYKKLKADYDKAIETFQEQDSKCDCDPVSISKLNGMNISSFDLATMRELGLFR